VIAGLGRAEPAARTDPVAVDVVLRIAGADIARIADAVSIEIGRASCRERV